MIKAAEPIRKCQIKKCSKELEQSKKFNDLVLSDMISIVKAYNENKITLSQYKKNTEALKKKILDSKPTQSLSKCSFEKCNKEVKQMTKNLQAVMGTECKKGNKGACEIEQKAAKVKSLSDYKGFIRTLAK